ncbi:MAG TPA: hypothetical protein VFO40_13335, partial [Chthoniobacterales bacterium]|nr:hypothetical protein [Chthoniobacterales bacterium]
MATAPLGPPPQSLRSTTLAGNTRLPNRIRRRPGEPTDNLTKPDYVGQASRHYQKLRQASNPTPGPSNQRRYLITCHQSGITSPGFPMW